MTPHLLLFVLIYSFSKVKGQGLRPPELTVSPLVITDSDSVTLNCQTLSSAPVSRCQFILKGHITLEKSACLQTLTGTELLKIINHHQTSPAKAKVKCFYTVKLGQGESFSADSETFSITINSLRPPKLTVQPSIITEMDSVTLNCQTPSSVSLTLCHFYFVRGKPAKRFSCLTTLSGAELLKITNQDSPAEVDVTCFYLVTYQSPESNVSSIIIQLPQPNLTVSPPLITDSDSVTLNCQTPSSVSVSQCLFHSMNDQTSRGSSCLKTMTGIKLLKMTHQRSPAVVNVTCYYTVTRRGVQYLSPYSNMSSIIIQNNAEMPPSTTQSVPTVTITPGETVALTSKTDILISTSATALETTFSILSISEVTTTTGTFISSSKPINATSGVPRVTTSKGTFKPPNKTINPTSGGTVMRKLLVIVTGFGLTVGVTLLGLVYFCAKRSAKFSCQRSQANTTDDLLHMSNIGMLPAGCSEGYSNITSIPGITSQTDSKQWNRRDSDEKSDTYYHVYATISEEAATPALSCTLYSTLQAD